VTETERLILRPWTEADLPVPAAFGLVIGNCGLKPLTIPWPDASDIEIGRLIREDCWGQGYAVEAATPMLALGLSRAPRVVAITATGNAASRQVMRKLGMRHETTLDFDHPDVAEGHFCRRHATYVMQRKCPKPTA